MLYDTLGFGPGRLVALNGYPSPLTGSDSVPVTLTVILGTDPQRLTEYLWNRGTSGWGGLLRGRWAYVVHDENGGRTLGHYEPETWALDRDREIRLLPPGPPVAQIGGRSYYWYGRPEPPPDLAALDSQLLGDQIIALTAEHIRLYPTVEMLGFWRGRMVPAQREGDTLHLVPNMAGPPDHGVRGSDPDFFAGMTFAHEGYRVFNGYGGSTVGPSLDSLINLNVNSLAIVPYTFLRNPNRVADLPVPDDAGSENDAAVCHSIREAHRRGLRTMLKPQIWVGRSWPGDIDFATAEEWDAFFTEYRDWMLHYARLAEREEVYALCLGTELVRATLEHPDRWRELISEARELFSGKLTYAANWGEEFERLSFWDELDIVGLNSYYPLSQSSSPTDAELRAGAERWMGMADSISAEHDLPLWLTEVGFRSVDDAWINPHAEAGDRLASVEAQRRCYEALLHAARRSDRLTGMFVWKWPSYLGHDEGRDGRNTGFTPGGKPAARALRKFYATSGQ
jgi:hypothetical protein